MDDMTREEFERRKAESAKRIREMYRGHNMPPYPDFISVKKDPVPAPIQKAPLPTPPAPQRVSGFTLQGIMKNPDFLLIIGLILLLLRENTDEKLILALIFIML